MEKKTVFDILGILETKDANLIKDAYRKKLISVNPEDDPEGFKELRTAYEEAIRLITVEEEEKPLKTPIDFWIDKVEKTYSSFSKRMNIDCWKDLFAQEICQDFDTEDKIKEALLVFLMDHYRLPSEIWKYIEEKLDIVRTSEELYEKFPANFIDFLLHQIQSDGWIDYSFFIGKDNADYDTFLDEYLKIRRMNDEKEYEEIEDVFEKIEKLAIQHPYLEVEKIRYQLAKKNTEEAVRLAKELRTTYNKDSYILYYVSEAAWEIGDFESAYKDCLHILEQVPTHFGAKYRIGDYYLEKEEYEKAKEEYMDLLEIDPENETLQDSFEKVNTNLIVKYEEQLMQMPDDQKLKMELGWCFFQTKRLKECIKLLEKVKIEDDIYYEYYNLKGRTYVAMEEYRKALPCLQTWVEEILKVEADGTEETNNKLRRLPFAYAMIATCYYQLGIDKEKEKQYLHQCIEYLDKAIEIEEDQHETIQYLARKALTLLKLEENEGCIDSCDKMITIYKDYFPAYVYRQEAYFNLRYGQEVIDDFYQAIEIFDGYAKPYILATKIFYIYDQYEDAIGIINRAKDAKIESNELAFQELKVKRMLAKTKEEREKILKDLTLLFAKAEEEIGDLEDLADILHEMAICYIQLNNNEKALELIEEKLNKKSTDSSLKLKADILYNLGEYEKAIMVYQQLLDKYPDYEHAIYDVADCYKELKQEEEAVKYYLQVLEVNKEHKSANHQLMEIYQSRYQNRYNKEDYQMAVSYAKRQVEIMPTVYYYNELGLLYLDGYDLEKAIEAFEAAIQEDQTDMHSYNNAGFTYKIMGNFKEAYKYYQLAIENRDSNYLRPYWNIAVYYKITKQYEKAIETYEYIIEQLPDSEEAISKLAEVYQRMGEWEKAIEQYKKALSITEDNALEYLLDIGRTFAYAGYKKEAMYYLKKTIRKYPKSSEPLSTLADYMGYLLGKKKKAYRYYKRAHRIAKLHDSYRYDTTLEELLQIKKILGKEKTSTKQIKALYCYIEEEYGGLDSWLSDYGYRKVRLYNIALWHYNVGDYEKAKYYLNQMKEASNCRHCQYVACFEYCNLEGLMLEQEGDYIGALEKYKEALEICPNDMYNKSKVIEIEKKVREINL